MSNTINNNKQILDIVLKIREAMRSSRLEVRHIAEITGFRVLNFLYSLLEVFISGTNKTYSLINLGNFVLFPDLFNEINKNFKPNFESLI